MKKDFISLVILLTLQYVSGRTFVPKSTVPQQQNNNRNAVTRTNVPSVETSREVGRGGAKVSGGTASISNEIFNLVKGIVGAGVLSLPAGIAAFGDAPSAVLPALALIAVIGTLSAYGFSIIGRVCAYTGATSLRDAWSRSVSEETSWIPAWTATLKTFLACLAYSMILADTFGALLGKERNQMLLGVTGFVLLPLCWLKNLSSLAPFSLVGVLGMVFTAIAMSIRYMDGSYAVGGNLVEGVAKNLQPNFGSKGWQSVKDPSSLILVCMLSTAFMAHFNAPKFYLELENNTMPRFNTVVGSSFGIAVLLIGFVAAIGFLSFGSNVDGLVLNNYASNDSWMSASRIAVAVSLVFSYPLAFQGFRDGVLDLLNIQGDKRNESVLNMATLALLGLLTALAAVLKDVAFVMAFGGATLGNLLTYVFPAVMYKSVVDKQKRQEGAGVAVSTVAATLGVVMGAVGAKLALDML